MKKRTAKDAVVATPEQIDRAPRGDLIHRNWGCMHTRALRAEHAPEADVRTAMDINVKGHPAWERGLMVRPSMPLKRRSPVETFNWHVRPRQLPVVGAVYPDGSSRDGPIPELERLGWAFVIVGSSGEILASAYGVPPPWITDIGGAEAWGLYQALLCTLPPLCRYWPDCYPVKAAVDRGPEVARDPRNPLARVHGMIHTALEGVLPGVVGWMPSRLTKSDLTHAVAKKSDGTLVNKVDLWANDVADKLAKFGVEHHRVPREEVKRWKAALSMAKARAKWIGMVTHAANNHPTYPFPRFRGCTLESRRRPKSQVQQDEGCRWQKKERPKRRQANHSQGKGRARHRGSRIWMRLGVQGMQTQIRNRSEAGDDKVQGMRH